MTADQRVLRRPDAVNVEVVEQVECLHQKLHFHLFREIDILGEARIERPGGRQVKGVAPLAGSIRGAVPIIIKIGIHQTGVRLPRLSA